MASLDTNCILRWLLDDVPAQTTEVDRIIATHPRLDVADVALVEVVFVLERVLKLPRSSVGTAFATLAAQSTIAFDRRLWGAVIERYLAHPKLSVADIYLALTADGNGAGPLLTFDKKLASQIDEAVLVNDAVDGG